MTMERVSKHLFVCLSLILAICFFLLNQQVPFFSDDIGWTNSIHGKTIFEKGCSVFETQEQHWLTQNGRISCHTFLQCTAGNGELVYDLFISLVLFLSVVFVKNLCVHKEIKIDSLIFTITTIAFLYFSPDSSSNFYWAAGGCNYLLPACFSLAYLYFLKRTITRPFDDRVFPFVALFSFIAGWTHEIFALPISFALFCFLLYDIAKGNAKQITKQQLCLIIPYWIGALLIVVSPGTLARIAGNGGAEGATFMSALMAKVVTSFKIFRYGRCFYVLLALLIYFAVSRQHSLRIFIQSNAFLFLSCLGSLGIVVILGVGGRAVWGVEVFSLLLIIKWLDAYLSETHNVKFWNKCGVVLSILIIIHQACLIIPFRDSWDTYRAMVEQTRQDDFEGTASMKDWKSDNPLIDPFVAHPYKMMMEDMWMRIPLHCNVCRTDVYDYLIVNGAGLQESVVQNIDGEFIVPYSVDVEKKIGNGDFEMKLKPMSYSQEGSLLYLTWHQVIQRLWPDRYPCSISSLYEGEVSILAIGGRKYMRFEQPVRPVYREIESVIIKHHE